ncbi:zinc ribbon domain-containing protein [Ligilactobacillus salivarius]|uniref:zinc ribbon domain-containing protein n=1 Tax=Ligilactobacillus salivarius TaxID=1624 RepID=UPI0013709F72|nr:zinc ribbon domain-containing protein [Ligilactobacillus salivarius]MYV10556.1 zinc ribbon domain-containing protein [Ligilactobacillus salivarius]
MTCKNCGNLNPEGSNYCNNCGAFLYNIDINELMKRHEDEVKNANIKKRMINKRRMDIRDMPKVSEKRYSSARLKTGTRREFDVYKRIKHINFDNDGLASLLDNWIYNPDTPVSEVDMFDRFNRLDCEVQ